jgi:hypothetical protein
VNRKSGRKRRNEVTLQPFERSSVKSLPASLFQREENERASLLKGCRRGIKGFLERLKAERSKRSERFS